MDTTKTTIRISKELRQEFYKLKEYRRESAEDLLKRLINYIKEKEGLK